MSRFRAEVDGSPAAFGAPDQLADSARRAQRMPRALPRPADAPGGHMRTRGFAPPPDSRARRSGRQAASAVQPEAAQTTTGG
ncbi:hypothetical protein ACWCW7_21415, partial [Nocardia tengchongensis]